MLKGDLVERVTVALYKELAPPYGAYGYAIQSGGWQPPQREQFRKAARAAIAAMREPTDRMLSAGWAWHPNVDEAWRAMIDAALVDPDAKLG